MEWLNDILQIPERSLASRKITKAFFKRNFELTRQERAWLDDPVVISSIDWIASINPANANVPDYKAEVEVYEELQVIAVQTAVEGFDINKQRVAELVQKYIPYHIVLFVHAEDKLALNTCDKRINQNDSSKRTIERRYFTEDIIRVEPTPRQQSFLESLKYTNLDKTSLKTLYDSYTQRIVALQASGLNGMFIPRSHTRTLEDMAALEQIETLEREISSLQGEARKETQMNQRVHLNSQIQEKRKEVDQLKRLITQ